MKIKVKKIITLSALAFTLLFSYQVQALVIGNYDRDGINDHSTNPSETVLTQYSYSPSENMTVRSVVLYPTNPSGEEISCPASLPYLLIRTGSTYSDHYLQFDSPATKLSDSGCRYSTASTTFTISTSGTYDILTTGTTEDTGDTRWTGSLENNISGQFVHRERLSADIDYATSPVVDLTFLLCDTTTCDVGDFPNTTSTLTPTYIEALSPILNATTSTTTVTLTGEYYLNSSTNNTVENTPTHIRISIFNTLFAGNETVLIIPITAVFDSTISFSTTTVLQMDQRYMWTAHLEYNSAEGACSSRNLASVFCAFQRLKVNQIASDISGNYFIIGNDPRSSITNFTDSVFGITTGQYEAPSLFGQCSFVATSTCDATSPSTYMGCLLNVLIITFCPSVSVINYATSTLLGSMANKIPFGYFYGISERLEEITGSTTGSQGSNINIHIASLGQATTTMFSWQAAHDFMYNVIPETAVEILKWCAWILASFFITRLVLKSI